MATIAEINETLDRVAEQQAKNERDIAAFVAGAEKTKAAIEALTINVNALTANVNARSIDVAAFETRDKRLTEKIEKVNEIVGNLGGRFGFIVEMLLIPGICPAINRHGHTFTRVCPDVKFQKKDIKTRTQIDLLLYDTTEVMAVEIKSRLRESDVEYHLERLKKIRALEKDLDISERTLYGAIAAISIDEDARKFALDNGLYVVEVQEDKDRLKTDAPAKGKVGKW